MGLFNNRNENESAYVGGKKHWVDIIKNSGDGDLLIWRQPEEDFNTNSTLIVMPGEEAIFVKGGVIEQTFTNGTYKLETQNYPFISRLRNAFSGGVSTFNCVVYFVKTTHSQEIDWGTMSPIQYFDDTFGNLNVKSYGAFKVHINNPSKFLTKLIGNNVDFETQQGLKKYFANEFQMHIVNSLSQTLDNLKASGKVIFETVRNTVEIASAIEPHIAEIIAAYGLSLDAFSVASCKAVSDDPEIQKMITDRARMNYLGQNWAAQQQVDILKNMSNNPGAGGIAAMGAGMGMGFASGGVLGNMAQQTMQGQTIANPTTVANPTMEKLKQLKEMLDMGLISQADFDAKKSEILSQM
ncbi:MAG: SPFH domain-containing protein [Bacteroidales bacterium]|nr:SPFH domain-containing protein [Bacteroidales bacterium]